MAQISDQRSCLRDRVWWELALVLLDVCHVLGWLKCLSLPFSNYYGMTKWIVPTFGSSSTMNRPSLRTLEHPWLIAKEILSFGQRVRSTVLPQLTFKNNMYLYYKYIYIYTYACVCVWLILWIVMIRLDDLWRCFVSQHNLFAVFEQHKHICDTPFRLSRQWMCQDS